MDGRWLALVAVLVFAAVALVALGGYPRRWRPVTPPLSPGLRGELAAALAGAGFPEAAGLPPLALYEGLASGAVDRAAAAELRPEARSRYGRLARALHRLGAALGSE